MAIYYFCRHCGTEVGKLEQTAAPDMLGFDKLTEQERQEMIQSDSFGNVHVKTICENCQESFTINPSNYENDYIIH